MIKGGAACDIAQSVTPSSEDGVTFLIGGDFRVPRGNVSLNIPSALSHLNIRIDGGPRGCGREARRIVYGNIH